MSQDISRLQQELEKQKSAQTSFASVPQPVIQEPETMPVNEQEAEVVEATSTNSYFQQPAR